MRLTKKSIQSFLSHQHQCSSRKNIQTAAKLLIQHNSRELSVESDFSYEKVLENFKWSVPEFFNFSKDVIDKFAETDGLVQKKISFFAVKRQISGTDLPYGTPILTLNESANFLSKNSALRVKRQQM